MNTYVRSALLTSRLVLWQRCELPSVSFRLEFRFRAVLTDFFFQSQCDAAE